MSPSAASASRSPPTRLRVGYDFEAAATHEVGHILGFSHPDETGEPLFKADCAEAACGPPSRGLVPLAGVPYDCMHPFESVRELNTSETARPSIMHSLTQHNPTVCLTADDLDGLYSLYPDCAMRPVEPVCFKASHNIGLVRLGVYILVPIIVALVFTTALGTYDQCFQMERLRSMKRQMRQKASLAGRARREASLAVRNAKEAERQLEQQKATEEARVSKAVETNIQARLQRAVEDVKAQRKGSLSAVVRAMMQKQPSTASDSLGELSSTSDTFDADSELPMRSISFMPKTISTFLSGVTSQTKSFLQGGSRKKRDRARQPEMEAAMTSSSAASSEAQQTETSSSATGQPSMPLAASPHDVELAGIAEEGGEEEGVEERRARRAQSRAQERQVSFTPAELSVEL